MFSSKSIKKTHIFSKSWKFWKKRCFDVRQAVRLHFFQKLRNHHLGRTARAKIRNNAEKAWFWWALDTVISCFQHFFVFIEIADVYRLLEQKNPQNPTFLSFLTRVVETQSDKWSFKHTKHTSLHKTAPSTALERPHKVSELFGEPGWRECPNSHPASVSISRVEISSLHTCLPTLRPQSEWARIKLFWRFFSHFRGQFSKC